MPRYAKYVEPTLPEGVFSYKPVLVREDTEETAITTLGRALSTPEDVVECVHDLTTSDRERFVVFMLNTKNRIIGRTDVSVGSLNASIVHPRELFKSCVIMGCAAIVVVHNHPSGDPTPSGADIQLTRRIIKAGDVLGIALLDHVVVGFSFDPKDAQFTSMRDTGLM